MCSQAKHFWLNILQSRIGRSLGLSLFWWSIGNNVSGHYFHQFFLTIFSLPHHILFSWRECLNQKTYFAKADGTTKKHSSTHASRPPRVSCGPLAAILNFAGRQRVSAPGAARLVLCKISLELIWFLLLHLGEKQQSIGWHKSLQYSQCTTIIQY